MHPLLQCPLDGAQVMAKKKRIRRELLAEQPDRLPCRIAILGGSTTATVKDALELFLLDRGIAPSFYESEYDKWYEDAQFGTPELDAFHPQVIYLHTSFVNLQHLPVSTDSAADVAAKIDAEFARFADCWKKLEAHYGAIILQNNFELPPVRLYGNLDAVHATGLVAFVTALNARFAEAARADAALCLQDLCYLAASYGLEKWHDAAFYALYKVALASDAIPLLAHNLAAMIGALYGKTKKCLVLDLDNTLWGGVVSEDEVAGLALGRETALGASYLAWQRYLLRLKARGILLAVCSKNDEDIAKSGFSHPDCLLKPDDFLSFQANWEPKSENIRRIADDIGIGLDSLVFVDDNPAERALVREQLPMVAVPEVEGGVPFSYIRAIEDGRYFETLTLSSDDLQRNATYRGNRARKQLAQASGSYDDFLQGLAMKAEIAPFREVYLARIAQLTNKSNQFNLTTRRYTEEELRTMAGDSACLTLYGRLVDRFGDNGLVSVIVARREGGDLRILLWLMSCRVLKRGMEAAMLDALVERARAMGAEALLGDYFPTKKNAMVAGLYESFGFHKLSETADGHTEWRLPLAEARPQGRFIERMEENAE